MQYLCTKQLTAGGITYCPGEIIPDGVILPERSSKLLRNGYISKLKESMQIEWEEMESVGMNVPETVLITVNRESDEENQQGTAVPATPEEIQQVFSIMQLNAEDGAKAITEVQSENVLILLHAADSRKTIKNAAKEQADNLFSVEGADA